MGGPWRGEVIIFKPNSWQVVDFEVMAIPGTVIARVY